MNLDTFSPSVQVILKEELLLLGLRLKSREDDLRLAAAEAILEGNDMQVQGQLKMIQELHTASAALDPKVLTAPPAVTSRPTAPLPLALPWKRHGLRVSLDGMEIYSGTDARTFAGAINAIGPERVAALGLIVNYCPLVSKEFRRMPHQRYSMQTERCGDWIVVTHCSTQRKRQLLNEIRRRLQLDLVAIVN
jgi:hypothetical protein